MNELRKEMIEVLKLYFAFMDLQNTVAPLTTDDPILKTKLENFKLLIDAFMREHDFTIQPLLCPRCKCTRIVLIRHGSKECIACNACLYPILQLLVVKLDNRISCHS